MNSTIRRRKAEEEDEEVMMFWLPAMYLLMSNGGIEKRVRHTSSQYGEDKIREILGGHEKNSLVAFRMEPNMFREIATYLRTEHLLRDTRGITVEEKLGHFLYMLSHNAIYEDLQHEFHHSGETIHRHIKSVFNIIPCLTYRFVKQPTGVETHWKISTDTRFFPYFKDCLGAIDGTHVHITISQDRYLPSEATTTQHYMGEDENFPFDSSIHNVESDGDELRIVEPVASGTAARSRMGKRVASSRNKDTATSDKSTKAAQRRRQYGNVVEIMGRFLEIKEKQVEAEKVVAQQEKERTNSNEEFSIPMCISVVDSMEELSDDEKVDAYDVFKDAQNRSIFLTAKASTRLKWLRKKIA